MVDSTIWSERCVVAFLDEPPFFSPVEGGSPVGCDIELTNMVLGALGVAEVEYVLTSFGELLEGVRTRRWHMNTPLFVTTERREMVRFSRPVWAAIDSFIVRRDDGRDFSSYEAIAADETVRLAAVSGQIQVDAALSAGTPSDRIVQFDDQDAAAKAVLDGRVDASVSTAPGNGAYLERLGSELLISVSDTRASDRGGVPMGAFSFHHDSYGLADAFDEQLSLILGSEGHLSMMRRFGFDEASLRPAIDF